MENEVKKKWKKRFIIVISAIVLVYLTLMAIQLIGVRNTDPFFISRMVVIVLGIIIVGFMVAKYKRELFEADVAKRKETVKCTLINYKDAVESETENKENK